MTHESVLAACRELTRILEDREKYPYGPPTSGGAGEVEAKQACVLLCGNDAAAAKALWETVSRLCGGYVPAAAAIALTQAYVRPQPDADPGAPEVE